jgi:hypothetical protein
MDIPLPGMADHFRPNLYKPLDDQVYGWSDALPPERRIPGHLEQVIRKASDEKPCLIRCKLMLCPMSAFVPSFYAVFNLGTTIVNRNYIMRFKILSWSHSQCFSFFLSVFRQS